MIDALLGAIAIPLLIAFWLAVLIVATMAGMLAYTWTGVWSAGVLAFIVVLFAEVKAFYATGVLVDHPRAGGPPPPPMPR